MGGGWGRVTGSGAGASGGEYCLVTGSGTGEGGGDGDDRLSETSMNSSSEEEVTGSGSEG